MVSGQVITAYGRGTDPNKQINDEGKPNYVDQGEFGATYQAINNRNAAGVSSYTVQAGDTLQGVARGLWGDASQWYRIADLNGLAGMGPDRALTPGMRLSLPSNISGLHNTSETFKPYDPSQVVGDTTPNMPAPPVDDGCGILGQIIMIVVAVVVALVAPQFLPTVITNLGPVAVAAASAVVGSVASQLVGMAIGAVDEFDWKAVALAGLGGAIGEYFKFNAFGAANGNSFIQAANVAVRTAVGNALTQRIAVVTGLQKEFSWRGVAASAVGAGVGDAVGGALNNVSSDLGPVQPAFSGLGNTGGAFARDFTKRFAGGLASSAVMSHSSQAQREGRGGQINLGMVAADAFGNALGNVLGNSFVDNLKASRRREAQARATQGKELTLGGQGFSLKRPSTFDSSNPFNLSAFSVGGLTPEQRATLEAAVVASNSPSSGDPDAPATVTSSASGSSAQPEDPNGDYMGKAAPTKVRAGDYRGSLELIARAHLGPNATQREINNYVGQLFEINNITNARRIGGDRMIELPGADTAAATVGLGRYGRDIAIGEQIKVQRAEAAAQAAAESYKNAEDARFSNYPAPRTSENINASSTAASAGGSATDYVDTNAFRSPEEISSTGESTSFKEGLKQTAINTAKLAVGATELVVGGFINGGLRIVGGLASIPYAAVKGVDAGVAVQESAATLNYKPRSEGAQMIGQGLEPVAKQVGEVTSIVRNVSERYLGDGVTTVLGATLQFGVEAALTVAGGNSLKKLVDFDLTPSSAARSTTTSVAAEVSETVAAARVRQVNMLADNEAFNISPKSWDQYPTIGRNGTFVTDWAGAMKYFDDVPAGQTKVVISAERAALIETDLGLVPGTLVDEPFKVRQVTGVRDMMPNSPTVGNEHFLGAGRHLPGGAPEMVINSIPTVDNAAVRTLMEVRVGANRASNLGVASSNSRIGAVGVFSELIPGRIGTTEMSGIARALRNKHGTTIVYDSDMAKRYGNHFDSNINQIHLQGGASKQRRGLFYEEVQHAFDHHNGSYSSSLTNKQLHAITARNLVENPLLPTTVEQNAALLELAERWAK